VFGRFLFRWRGVIGFVAFGVVFWLARPTTKSCLLGLPVVLVGLATRFWASGYIGIEGRVREIGGQTEERGVRREDGGTPRRRIVAGPYRILRHPLYIGNFMLVAGMLLALRPAVWMGAVVLAGFLVEYSLIVGAEERYLADRIVQNPEVRNQNAEFQIVVSGRREAESESFLLSRALVEWRTWVVTGVGYGLALVKALLVRS